MVTAFEPTTIFADRTCRDNVFILLRLILEAPSPQSPNGWIPGLSLGDDSIVNIDYQGPNLALRYKAKSGQEVSQKPAILDRVW